MLRSSFALLSLRPTPLRCPPSSRRVFINAGGPGTFSQTWSRSSLCLPAPASFRSQPSCRVSSASSGPEMSEELSSLTVAELKVRLKSRGLPVSGNKAKLVARLSEPSGGVAPPETSQKTNKRKRGDETNPAPAMVEAKEDTAAEEKETEGAIRTSKKRRVVESKAILSYQLPERLQTPMEFHKGPTNFKILNWNVGGYRAAVRKGLEDVLRKLDADVVCLCETKATEDQIETDFEALGYPHVVWNPSTVQKGYAGTAVLSKIEPLSVKLGIGYLDDQGRCITMEFEDFYLINTYVPNSGQGLKFAERRKAWNENFDEFILGLQKKKPVIWTGDMNVAHYDFDVYDGEVNKNRHKSAGFTHAEREHFHNLIENEGFVDCYRAFYPHAVGAETYTFWSMRAKMRPKQLGWRLDYFVMTPSLVSQVTGMQNLQDIHGSDHAPQLLSLHLPQE